MHDLLSAPIGRRAALRRLSYVLGGVATAPLASGLLGGCRAPGPSYAYQTLNDGQQRTVAALVERIIPTTDTPGAADAGVPQFVDMMLTEWYAPEERDGFLAGLAQVDSRAEGGSFADLGGAEQARLVEAMDAETYPAVPEEPVDGDVASAAQEGTYKANEEEQNEVAGMQGDLGEAMDDEGGADAGAERELNTGEGRAHSGGAADEAPPFFRQLKELTVAGYYTSEVGASQELRYNAVMGRYDADVPLSEIGSAWA